MKTGLRLIGLLALCVCTLGAAPSPAAKKDAKCNSSNDLQYCVVEATLIAGKTYGRRRDVTLSVQLSITNRGATEVSAAFSNQPLQVVKGGVALRAQKPSELSGILLCKTGMTSCVERYGNAFTNIAPKQEVFVTILFGERVELDVIAAVSSGDSPLLTGQLILVGPGSPATANVSIQGFKVHNRMTP